MSEVRNDLSSPQAIVWAIAYTRKDQIRSAPDCIGDTDCIGFKPSAQVAHVIASTAELAAMCFRQTNTGYLAYDNATKDPHAYRIDDPFALCVIDAQISVSRIALGF